MRVFIIGSRSKYRRYDLVEKEFEAAEKLIQDAGAIPVSSLKIFEAVPLNKSDYKTISRIVMYRCDGIYLLGGWEDNWLCQYQNKYAKEHDMKLFIPTPSRFDTSDKDKLFFNGSELTPTEIKELTHWVNERNHDYLGQLLEDTAGNEWD